MKNSTAKLTIDNTLKIKSILKRAAYISLFLVLGTILFITLLQRQATDVKSAKAVHDQTQALLTKEKEATGLLEKYQGEDQKIGGLYPDARSIIKFVDEIEGLASVYGTSAEFNFGSQAPLKDIKGYPFLPFTVSFTGNKSSILSFLENFENIPYLISVTSVEGRKLSSVEDSGTYIIKGRVYVSENF